MINFNFRAGIVGVVFVLLTSLRLLLAQTASQTFRTVESPTIMGVSELGNTADGVCSPGSSYSVRAFLDSSLDFKEDILRTIQSSGKNEAVHLYSHGTPGLLFLDGKWRDQYDIVTWIQDNKLLANQTQLNIYGCNFAKGLSGQAAVSHIEAALGVKVAASDNITGKGGDWNLEVGNGQSAIAVKNYPAALQLDCPVLTTPAYPKSVDLIITSYHQHIARGQNVFFTWGEDMAANGANATVMTPITPANGYNYTGAIRMFAVSGNTDGQGFLLTTTGLYAWGSRLEVLGAPLATSNSFSAVALPAGVAANDVLDIKANSDVLFLVTNAGEVYVTGLVVTQVAGNGAPVNNQWNRVKINATTNLTGVVELSGSREAVYARKADGTLWTWGRGVALGGGAAPAYPPKQLRISN